MIDDMEKEIEDALKDVRVCPCCGQPCQELRK